MRQRPSGIRPAREHSRPDFQEERMFNFRPPDPWPWLNVKPPDDDPPGFRLAPDGSTRDDVAFGDPASAAASASPAGVGFRHRQRPWWRGRSGARPYSIWRSEVVAMLAKFDP